MIASSGTGEPGTPGAPLRIPPAILGGGHVAQAPVRPYVCGRVHYSGIGTLFKQIAKYIYIHRACMETPDTKRGVSLSLSLSLALSLPSFIPLSFTIFFLGK